MLTGEAKAALAEGTKPPFTVLILVCPKLGTHHLQDYASGNGYTAGKAAAAAALTLPDDQIVIGIHEVPPSQAMEMGQIMPEVETS